MDEQNNPATDTPYQRRVRVLKAQADSVYAYESAKISKRQRVVERAREDLELAEAELSVATINAHRRIHAAQDELSKARQAARDEPSPSEIEALFARAARAAREAGFQHRSPRGYR